MMNWGTKLMIGMGLFMSFIIVLAVLMFNSKADALVDNDYYEKGLNYDQEYNSKEQVIKDNARPEVKISSDLITIVFKDHASGSVRMMHNSDKKLDKRFALETDVHNKFHIPIGIGAKGRWKLTINWVSNGNAYLDEQEIIVE